MSKPYALLNLEQNPNPYPGTTLAFTVDSATDIITCTGHPYADGDAIKMYSTTTLPAGLTSGQTYYVRDVVAATSFKVAAAPAGAAVDITDTGTGTHYVGELQSSDVFWIPSVKLKRKINPVMENRDDEMRGLEDPVAEIPIALNPEWGLPGMRCYPNLVPLFFILWGGNVTTTAGDGAITDPDGNTIPANCYRHVISFRTGIIPTSMRIRAADDYASGPYWLQTGAFLKSLKLAGGSGSLMMDADGEALYEKRETSRPSACDTPALPALSLWPFSTTNLRLTALLNAGGAWPGFTDIEIDSFNLEFTQDAKAFPAGRVPSLFRDAVELESMYRKITGSFNTRSLDKDDWDAMVAGTTFDLTARWQSGQVIANSYPYRMWVQMPEAQITVGDEGDIENKPRIPFNLTVKATYDSSATYAGKVTIVNGISAYKTGITIS